MRVLITTGIYPPESGGPATYVRLLEERLPSLGFSVTVLPFRRVRALPKVLRHMAYFSLCLMLGRKADVIYAQDTVSVGFPAALASLVLSKKLLVRVPGDYAWEQARSRFGVEDELDEFQEKSYGARVETLRKVQRFVIAQAKAVVVPSEYLKKIVSGWGTKRVERIYSSIALPPRYATKQKPEGFFVVTIARPVPWKGLDGLKRVVAREAGWTLKIINDMSHEEAMGWVKAADAFVINSTYEGLSHALIEAMVLGTPVVATRVGGNPELIRDGIDGLLVPPKDDDALYVALKSIEQNPSEARVRAASAKQKLGVFSIDTTISQIASLLKSI